MRKTKTNDENITTNDRDELAQRAAALEAEASKLQIHAHELRVRLARGTRDVPNVPAAAVVKPATTGEPTTTELYAKIEALITERPRTFREIVQATHAGENRIKSVIVRLQRDRKGVVNLGNGSRALWWIDSAGRLNDLKR